MLGLYKDASCVNAILQPEVFTRAMASDPGYTTFPLSKLTTAQVDRAYKYNGSTFSRTTFTVSSGNVVLGSALGASELLVVVPSGRLDLLFGGAVGDTVVKTVSIWLKRAADCSYTGTVLTSRNIVSDAADTVAEAVAFTAGVSNAFGTALPDMTGWVALLDGSYVGDVASNTATAVTLTTSITQTGDLRLMQPGEFTFSLDGNAYAKAVNIADITDDTAVRVYVRDTKIIPATAVNYPNQAIRVRTTEFTD